MPGLNLNNVDVSRMSREARIPESTILKALGQVAPLPDFSHITTIEEALELHNKTPVGSDEEKAVLLRWCELITTIEEARDLYNKTPGGSDEEKAVLQKMAEFFRK